MESRVVYDVDGVLANFAQSLIEKAIDMGLGSDFPASWLEIKEWFFSPRIPEVWSVIEHDIDFWLNIKPLDGSLDSMVVKPFAYLTARPIPSEITSQWLVKNGFPNSQVFTVEPTGSKVALLKSLRADALVDDRLENCLEVRDSGILSIMFAQPHNYSHGYKPRISSLSELPEVLKSFGKNV